MSYGIYLKLDQTQWFTADFSDTNKLTGTIYSDNLLSTAFNLTGYTIKVRMFKRGGASDHFDKTASIVNAANGTWSYAVAESEIPSEGLYLVKIELSKSGERMSTLNIQELLIIKGPSA